MEDIRAGLRRCIERTYQAISEIADPVEGYRQATEVQSDLRQAAERPALRLRAVMARRVEAAGFSGSTAVGRVLGLSKQRAQQLLQLTDREEAGLRVAPGADPVVVDTNPVVSVVLPKQVIRMPQSDEDRGAPARQEMLIPPREISELLDIGPRARVLMSEWTIYRDDQPVQLTTSYTPGRKGPERGHEVARFREETEILHPSQAQMNFLGIGPADYVVELTRLSYNRNGTALELTVNAFRADRIRLMREWARYDELMEKS